MQLALLFFLQTYGYLPQELSKINRLFNALIESLLSHAPQMNCQVDASVNPHPLMLGCTLCRKIDCCSPTQTTLAAFQTLSAPHTTWYSLS